MRYQKSRQNGPSTQKATFINQRSSALPQPHAAKHATGRSRVNPTSAMTLMKLRITAFSPLACPRSRRSDHLALLCISDNAHNAGATDAVFLRNVSQGHSGEAITDE